MKKITLLSSLALAAFLHSCSTDDDSGVTTNKVKNTRERMQIKQTLSSIDGTSATTKWERFKKQVEN